MNILQNRNILIAVTGSIAAYKAVEVVRLLKKQAANVKVVMSEDAKQFVTELTFQAVSGEPVRSSLLDPTSEASMSHISLAKWADLLVVVPATANIMAKLHAGIADDLLTTIYLAYSKQTAIVPAMNQQMWQHPATAQNYDSLLARGVLFFGPEIGSQACGDEGPGRMLEPQQVVAAIEQYFQPKLLANLTLLITAGPTREPIDPVRFISNYSSGKMGYALAQAAADLGANVILVSGPTALKPPGNMKVVQVETAEQMLAAVKNYVADADIFISCAAVVDYKPQAVSPRKIKKRELTAISLQENPDILKSISAFSKAPFLVGFAAETDNLIENARKKLEEKNLALIIANQVNYQQVGCGSDYNQVVILTKEQEIHLPFSDKAALAREIMPILFSVYRQSVKKCDVV